MPEPENLEIELELTYLARSLPVEISDVAPKRLLDIYVPEISNSPFIRLRKKGNEYKITKKKPIDDNDASRQSEQTIPLDHDEFDALSVASKRSVEKDRYKVVIGGNTAEVDIFDGALKGLVLIDFEFETIEAKAAFNPPEYCLADVTQERFVAGGQLAGCSYADIEADLARFEYIKLLP